MIRALHLALAFLLLAFSTADAKRVFIQRGYATAPFTYNITTANTSNFRTVFRGATRNIIVAFMGDSTMRGVNEGAVPYNSQYPNAMPMQLAAKLNTAGTNAGANNWYGLSGTTLNDYVIRDSRIAVVNGVVDSAVVQGGAAFALTAAGSISFTSKANCTKADIYQYDFFAAATISWQVDGGATTNIVQVGNNTIRKTTIPLGIAGIHTVLLSWVSGNNSIFGIDCYNDTASRIEVHIEQWGISGGTSGSMVDDTGSPHAGRLTQLTNFPPDLVFCECGLVNDWRSSVPVATTKANLTTLVTAVKATGANFIFITPPYDNGVAGFTANQNAYVQAMYQVAFEQNVGLIDLRQHWLSYANAVTNGWQVNSDAVHPTVTGYIDEAQVLFNVINAIK